MSIWCYYIFWRRSGSAATAGDQGSPDGKVLYI